MECVSYVQMFLILQLSLEFFKNFSVLGNHFTVNAIVRLQYIWTIWYLVTLCIPHLGFLLNIGHKSAPFIRIVRSD